MLVALACSLVLVSACGDDAPDDALSAEVVRPYAEPGVKGLQIVDYQRENGWVDSSDPNQYVVRYKFNLRLERPFPEVVLDLARDFELLRERRRSAPGTAAKFVMAFEDMRSSAKAINWMEAQGSEFEPRLDRLSSKCAGCRVYLNGPVPVETRKVRREKFALAWSHLEELGFPDSSRIGDTAPGTAWASFLKTERGWRPFQQ
ncbi:MAG: hypothetical protein H3C59_13255 [Burkholderiaceae bacterium]|nr:hypothetical protein [Burkholderiaceae bacterium]